MSGGQPRSRVFYGWYLVAAVFVVLTVVSGLTVYGLSVYLHAFVDEGRFSLGQVSFASGAFSAAGGVVGLVVGRLLDRHDVRLVMSAGCVLMIGAFLSLPLVRSVAALYLFYAVLGVGFGTGALIPCTTLVTRWFSERRSAALSIASTGNSFGAVVLVPPVALLVGEIGLDRASPWIAALLAAVTLPLIWGVLRSWPAELGLAPDGKVPGPGAAAASAEDRSDAAYRRAVRTRFFRGASLAFMLGMSAHFGGQTHLFNLMMGHGMSTAFASAAISAMAASSVLARFPAVWLMARIGNRRFMALLLIVQGLALWGCGFVDHPAWLLLCIVAYGSTLGNFVTVQSLVLAEAYGVGIYARLYGMSRVWGVPGVMIGPGVMGLLHQHSGSYLPGYLVIGAVSIAGVAAPRLAGRPQAA